MKLKIPLMLVFLLLVIGSLFCQDFGKINGKTKPDFEITLLGGSISLFKKEIKNHSLGLSLGLLNYGYVLFDNPYYKGKQKPFDDNRVIIEYGKVKFFYRYEISSKISIQTSLKYNYTMFGEENCDPCYDALFGMESSIIYKFGKVGYKFDISSAMSFKTKKNVTFINPLIICFNF